MLPVEPLHLLTRAPTLVTADALYDRAAVPPRDVLAADVVSVVTTLLEADGVTVVATAVHTQATAVPLVYQAELPPVAAGRLYVVRTVTTLTGGRVITAERPGVPLTYAGER